MDLKIVDKDGWIVTFPVEEDENGCLNFIGTTVGMGYGRKRFKDKMWLAHRLVWSLTNGTIPEGSRICHECDNPRCVNIEHLYAGDDYTNQQDAVERGRHAGTKKTHCPKGHKYTLENTRYSGTSPKLRRHCRTCERERIKWNSQ